jgi:hypothetical protein
MRHQSNLHAKAENTLSPSESKSYEDVVRAYHLFSYDVGCNSKTLGLNGKILEAIGFVIPDFFHVCRNCPKIGFTRQS